VRRLRGIKVVTGLCAALATGPAWADSSPFVGRWHRNPAQSTMPPGEPAPSDLTAEFSRADSSRLTWSATIVTPQGRRYVDTFDVAPDGKFYPISRIGMVLSLSACADDHYAYDPPYYDSWAFGTGVAASTMTGSPPSTVSASTMTAGTTVL
jgi:hypothetical protein